MPKIAVFCSSRASWCPGMLLTDFLNDFEIVPVAPIVTGITLVFTFHIRCISIVRSLYFKCFQLPFYYISVVVIIIIIIIISSSSSSSSNSAVVIVTKAVSGASLRVPSIRYAVHVSN